MTGTICVSADLLRLMTTIFKHFTSRRWIILRSRDRIFISMHLYVKNMHEVWRLIPKIREIFMKRFLKIFFFCLNKRTWFKSCGTNFLCIAFQVFKAGDTPGDFKRRSPRSAYKIADIWHVRYRRASVPVPAIFYARRCKSPLKSTNQVGRFYHDFSKWFVLVFFF